MMNFKETGLSRAKVVSLEARGWLVHPDSVPSGKEVVIYDIWVSGTTEIRATTDTDTPTSGGTLLMPFTLPGYNGGTGMNFSAGAPGGKGNGIYNEGLTVNVIMTYTIESVH